MRKAIAGIRDLSPRRSALSRVCLTVALPLHALLVNEWLRGLLQPTFEPAFTAAVTIVCWFCGPVYAIAALALSAALLLNVFIVPYYGLHLSDPSTILKFCFFLGVNALIVGLLSNLYRAQAKALKSEKMYRNLSELIPFGGWISDPGGNMQHVSDSFLNTFGVTLEACQGLGWIDLIAEEQRDQVRAEWTECMQSGYFWDYEYRLVSRSGEARAVLSRGVPVLDPSGRTSSWVGIHLDVTERERSIEEQVRQARDIARFNAELEQLAYVSAHDLQEPLRIISGYLQLLQRKYSGKLDSEADEFIGFAVEGANRLRSLLQDLMLLQNIGKGANIRAKFQLKDLIDLAVENLGETAENAQIECGQLPEVVCSKREFIQLFEHLVDNALKYRREGVPPTVFISAESASDGYIVCVRDNGIGIDPTYAYRIFDVFQRLHTRSAHPGTG
ncbi:MAG: PAS domain S-box protein, partial [Bryobacteraceae bacterium]|nr:PAS domain S-box protein [Bryobacteraceae bacterium]